MNTRPTGAAHVIETPQLGLTTDQRSAGTRQLLSDYVELTKPKVQSLLLLTTIATMYVAGDPSLLLVALTCLGGYLSAGGAGAVNHWFDRDIDARMARTATRPVPSGRVSPGAALAFGCTLAGLSFLELTLAVNVLAASLSFAGFLGYVFLYTIWLKRRTPQNIVIGGAAGAIPPLVGWAAVTGSSCATRSAPGRRWGRRLARAPAPFAIPAADCRRNRWDSLARSAAIIRGRQSPIRRRWRIGLAIWLGLPCRKSPATRTGSKGRSRNRPAQRCRPGSPARPMARPAGSRSPPHPRR